MKTKKTLSVIVGKDEIPQFNSEAEEAEWWDKNPDFVLKKLKEQSDRKDAGDKQ